MKREGQGEGGADGEPGGEEGGGGQWANQGI